MSGYVSRQEKKEEFRALISPAGFAFWTLTYIGCLGPKENTSLSRFEIQEYIRPVSQEKLIPILQVHLRGFLVRSVLLISRFDGRGKPHNRWVHVDTSIFTANYFGCVVAWGFPFSSPHRKAFDVEAFLFALWRQSNSPFNPLAVGSFQISKAAIGSRCLHPVCCVLPLPSEFGICPCITNPHLCLGCSRCTLVQLSFQVLQYHTLCVCQATRVQKLLVLAKKSLESFLLLQGQNWRAKGLVECSPNMDGVCAPCPALFTGCR